jgi:hypothetical protein
MSNPYPPNTYKWKLFEDFQRNQTIVQPAPGGKTQRYDLKSQIGAGNTIFNLSLVPDPNVLQVVYNGQNMDATDFQVAGSVLTTTPGLNGLNTGFTPKTGDSLFIIA